MENINITVVGAGVIGLAIAAELSKTYQDICLIERNSTFGQETSSRNSEVIHAGIYYPKDSLKAKTCIEGKNLLYAFCAKENIPYKKAGKLIVAIDESELDDLNLLFKQGLENGVDDLRVLSSDGIKEIEPHIKAAAAIYSPSTGIIDTHRFMQSLVWQFKDNGGQLAYNTKLVAVSKNKDVFEIVTKDNMGEEFKFTARIVINCAGLNSDEVAAICGVTKDEYKLKYCKGDYFRVSPSKAKLIQGLVYPVPKKDRAGLGIHATVDLAGGLRLGPDDEYVDRIYYDVDAKKSKIFYESCRQFMPFITPEDITPDMAGMRPKLQGKGEAFRDFIIKSETNGGLPGLINLIGIESPGLTASLSIARIVGKLVAQY